MKLAWSVLALSHASSHEKYYEQTYYDHIEYYGVWKGEEDIAIIENVGGGEQYVTEWGGSDFNHLFDRRCSVYISDYQKAFVEDKHLLVTFKVSVKTRSKLDSMVARSSSFFE